VADEKIYKSEILRELGRGKCLNSNDPLASLEILTRWPDLPHETPTSFEGLRNSFETPTLSRQMLHKSKGHDVPSRYACEVICCRKRNGQVNRLSVGHLLHLQIPMPAARWHSAVRAMNLRQQEFPAVCNIA
jgi:hypothetical protein